jgi:hypothetical protein
MGTNMPNAKGQERALGRMFRNSKPFVDWFLGQTKFNRIVDAEVVLIRDDWPWYQASDGSQSETDVLAVFRSTTTAERFALHIENKTAKDHFRVNQPENYLIRAKDWLGQEKWGNYQDFECVLVAPLTFANKHLEDVRKFNRFISHEALAEMIPEFAIDKEA